MFAKATYLPNPPTYEEDGLLVLTFGQLGDTVDLLVLPQLAHDTLPFRHALTAPLQPRHTSGRTYNSTSVTSGTVPVPVLPTRYQPYLRK